MDSSANKKYEIGDSDLEELRVASEESEEKLPQNTLVTSLSPHESESENRVFKLAGRAPTVPSLTRVTQAPTVTVYRRLTLLHISLQLLTGFQFPES